MKTYKLYLIRNGLTAGNLAGKYIGHTDEHLCPAGERDLRELAEKAFYPEAEVIFSSPLKRCLETAEIVYPDRQPIVLNDLIECDLGAFEGKTADELIDDEDFVKWVRGEPGACPPFGEDAESFARRVCACFSRSVDALIREGITTAAYVTHGGVIMTILSAFGLPEAPMTQWRSEAGGGYALLVNTSVWSRLKKAEIMDRLPYRNWDPDADDADEYGEYDDYGDDPA